MSGFDLSALTADYARKLPHKLADLDAALAPARSDRGALDEATRLAHRLRGTAGSYGLPLIGQAAGRVEEALLRIARGDAEAGWTALDGALAELRRVCAEAAAAHA